jgi:hypothetical protein
MYHVFDGSKNLLSNKGVFGTKTLGAPEPWIRSIPGNGPFPTAGKVNCALVLGYFVL